MFETTTDERRAARRTTDYRMLEYLALAAVAATIAPAGLAAPPAERLWEHLSSLDVNQDGEISREEFDQGASRFPHLDRNGDGVLTEDDLAGGPAFAGPAAGSLVVRFADIDRDGTVSTDEWRTHLETVDPDGDGLIDAADLRPPGLADDAPHAERMRQRMQQVLDQDGDGSVETEDLDAIFSGLDRDSDGAVSRQEMPLMRGPHGPHGRRGLGLGRRPDPGSMAGVILARIADDDGDGAVADGEWQGFLDALSVDADGAISEESLQAVLAQRPEARSGRGRSAMLVRLLDRDGDGMLEIEDLNAVFAGLDADGDGALLGEEMPRFGPRHPAAP